MANRPAERSADTATAHAEKLGEIAKDNTVVLITSSKAATATFASLAKAYQDYFTHIAATLSKSVETLSVAKTPTEFYDIRWKLAQEAFATAAADAKTIAELTASVFSTALEPVQKHVSAMPEIVKTVVTLPWVAPKFDE